MLSKQELSKQLGQVPTICKVVEPGLKTRASLSLVVVFLGPF